MTAQARDDENNTHWLMIGGPADGTTDWKPLDATPLEILDADGRSHAYQGRTIEIDGRQYKVALAIDTTDDEIREMIGSSGLQPFR